MKAALKVLIPRQMKGKTIPLTSRFEIGRGPQCHLQPDNAAVNERHCAFEVRDNNVFLQDLESAGGTFVNEARIQGEVELHQGDRVKVGPLLFEVNVEAEEEAPAAPPPSPLPAASPPPAPRIDKVFLKVLAPKAMEGEKVPVSQARFVIGRAAQCHMQPSNSSIAEFHCALEVRDNKVFLEDLESASGTFVNDAAVKGEVQVQEGDRIKVGPLAFVLEITFEKPAPAPPPDPKKEAPPVETKTRPEPRTYNASAAATELLKRMLRRRKRSDEEEEEEE